MRMSQAALRYVDGRRKRRELAETTVPNVVSALLKFSEFVDDREVSRVTRRQVESWLESLDLAPGTMRNRLSTLRTFFEWAVDNRLTRTDPCKGIKSVRVPRSLPRGLENESVGAVFGIVPDARGELVVSLMVQEGLRRSEVARLQVADINWSERLMLVKGKGGHERVLPITDATWRCLQNYGRPSSGFLIRSYAQPARGISSGRVGKMVTSWMKDAGVKQAPRDGVSPHAFRHTCATDMLRNGASILNVQAVLGHRSVKTTQIYLPWQVGDLADAMGGRSYR